MDKIQNYFILLIFLITFCFANSAIAEDYKISEGKDSIDIIHKAFQQITFDTYASLNKIDSDVTEEASRDSLRTITRMPRLLAGDEWLRLRSQSLQASPSKFELFRCENLLGDAPTFGRRSSLIDPDYLPSWYEMITNVPGDLWNFAKAEYESPNLPVYLLLAGTTAGLILTDNRSYEPSHRFYLRKQFNRHISDLFAEAGDGRTQFGIAACFAAFGFISDDHRALRTASEIVEAVLASGTVVQVIKHITGREDPVRASSPRGTWRFFPGQKEYLKDVPKYDAFPSGHLATSIATFVFGSARSTT